MIDKEQVHGGCTRHAIPTVVVAGRTYTESCRLQGGICLVARYANHLQSSAFRNKVHVFAADLGVS